MSSYTSYPVYTTNDMANQWPIIVKTNDGTLHAFFNKKGSGDTKNLHTTESTDNGQTWSIPVQIYTTTIPYGNQKINACVAGDGVNIYVANPGGPNGTLLYGSGSSYNQVTTYSDSMWADISVSGNNVYLIDQYYSNFFFYMRIQYSSNNGSSFSSYTQFIGTTQLKGYSIASDGLNVYVLYTEDVGGNNTLKAIISSDGGATFSPIPQTIDSSLVANYPFSNYQNLALSYDNGKLYTSYLKGPDNNTVTSFVFGTSTNGTSYTLSSISVATLPSPTQAELSIKISGSTIYIVYLDSAGTIRSLTSTNNGVSFTDIEVSPIPSPNTQFQCGFELGSVYILYTVISGGVPSMYIATNYTPGPTPTPTMCFHSDSVVTLKNGKDTHISDINPGDQLIDNNNNILTVTKLLIQPPVEDYYQLDDNTLVTGNHLIKTPDNRTRLAKYSKLKLVKKPTHKCDYHICTDGPNSSHFIPVKNGYYVEVIGKLHPSVRKNES